MQLKNQPQKESSEYEYTKRKKWVTFDLLDSMMKVVKKKRWKLVVMERRWVVQY